MLHVFKAKGYLEAIQISKVEIFCENSQQLLTIWAKISILDVFLGSEFVSAKPRHDDELLVWYG